MLNSIETPEECEMYKFMEELHVLKMQEDEQMMTMKAAQRWINNVRLSGVNQPFMSSFQNPATTNAMRDTSPVASTSSSFIASTIDPTATGESATHSEGSQSSPVASTSKSFIATSQVSPRASSSTSSPDAASHRSSRNSDSASPTNVASPPATPGNSPSTSSASVTSEMEVTDDENVEPTRKYGLTKKKPVIRVGTIITQERDSVQNFMEYYDDEHNKAQLTATLRQNVENAKKQTNRANGPPNMGVPWAAMILTITDIEHEEIADMRYSKVRKHSAPKLWTENPTEKFFVELNALGKMMVKIGMDELGLPMMNRIIKNQARRKIIDKVKEHKNAQENS